MNQSRSAHVRSGATNLSSRKPTPTPTSTENQVTSGAVKDFGVLEQHRGREHAIVPQLCLLLLISFCHLFGVPLLADRISLCQS